MIRFQLATSSGMKFDDEVYEVIVPTRDGSISIFEDHMPIISAAKPGILSVRKKQDDNDNELEQFAIKGGVVEVDGKSVSFVSDDITTADEVSEQQAAAAMARAEELVKNAENRTELHEAHRTLQHTSAQLHLARLKSRHHR